MPRRLCWGLPGGCPGLHLCTCCTLHANKASRMQRSRPIRTVAPAGLGMGSPIQAVVRKQEARDRTGQRRGQPAESMCRGACGGLQGQQVGPGARQPRDRVGADLPSPWSAVDLRHISHGYLWAGFPPSVVAVVSLPSMSSPFLQLPALQTAVSIHLSCISSVSKPWQQGTDSS